MSFKHLRIGSVSVYPFDRNYGEGAPVVKIRAEGPHGWEIETTREQLESLLAILIISDRTPAELLRLLTGGRS